MIPKTPGERIAAAQHAIETRQFRLARLYMELASEELTERKFERMTPFERGAHEFTQGMNALARIIEKTWAETILPALERLSEDLRPLAEAINEDTKEHETETR